MKRDMDLVRKILLAMESEDRNDRAGQLEIEGYDEPTIGFHVFIMDQAGLVRSSDVSHMESPCKEHSPIDITWDGYEFLDLSRDDRVWTEAKNRIGKNVSSASFSILAGVLSDLITWYITKDSQ